MHRVLVDSNVVATNSHCIPAFLKAPGADCSKNIGIKFPATSSFGAEERLCDKIFFASAVSGELSPKGVNSSDYAFFSMTRNSAANPLHLSRNGIPNGEIIKIHSFDPLGSELGGTFVTRTCQIVRDVFFPLIDSSALSFVPAAFGTECSQIRMGNSGSPAVTSNGEVIGLVHAYLESKISNSYPDLPVFSSREKKPLGRPQLITNLACIPAIQNFPLLGEPNSNCE